MSSQRRCATFGASLLVILFYTEAFEFDAQTYRNAAEICHFYTGVTDQEGWGQRAYQFLRNSSSSSVGELLTPSALQQILSPMADRVIWDPIKYLSDLNNVASPAHPLVKFPRLVHMSMREKDSTTWDPVTALSITSWLLMNPWHVVLLYDDGDMEQYIARFAPSHLQLFQSFEYGVQKSDFWRYMVMCGHGGVYADSDTLCIAPVDDWNANNEHDAEVLLGLESIYAAMNHATDTVEFGAKFTQWVLTATPGQDLFCKISETIASQTIKVQTPDLILKIVYTTGPAMFSTYVRNHIAKRLGRSVPWMELSQGGHYGKIRVLGLEAFGCATRHFSGRPRQGVYLFHAFRSSWHHAKKVARLPEGGNEGL